MLQHRAARFVANKPWYKNKHNESITKILTDLHWPTLESRRKQARLILMFKIVNGLLTVPARCLPLPPSITCTRANHSEICTSTAKFESVQIFFPAQNNPAME